MNEAIRALLAKAQPTLSDVHVNRPLTDISVAYSQQADKFAAAKVFPSIPVAKQADSYYVYDKGDWFRSSAQKRAPGAESAGTGYNVSTATYASDVYALHHDVPDQLRSNQDAALNLDRSATEFLTHQMLLLREVSWAAKYFVTSVWTGASDVTVSPKWDASSATPIEDLRAKIDAVEVKTGFRPNTLVLGALVWNTLVDHEDLLARIQYTQTGIVSTALLAAVLEIDQVFVMRAIQNTANEGATAVMARIATAADCLIVYANPRPGLMVPSGGYTFSWTGYIGAGGDGSRTKRFRMEQNAADRVEVEMAWDQKLVGSDLGVFFDNVLT